MKIGISTFYAMNSKTAVQAAKQLKEEGINAIELMYESKKETPINKEDIKELKKLKLEYSMHGPFLGQMFAHPNPLYERFYTKLVKDALECAAKIDCKEFVMHGGKVPSSFTKVENGDTREYYIDLFIKRYGKLFEEYNKKGLKILIENLQDEDIGGRVSDIAQIKKSLPFIGLCFDIAHAENTGTTNDIIKKFGKEIKYVHATDNNLKKDQHLAVGEGKIDFKDIFSRLKISDAKITVECLTYKDCIKSKERLAKILSK